MTSNDLAWKTYLRGVPLGTILGPEGWRYRITWEDAMWAVRAVRGESGVHGISFQDGRAVTWTMINRHVMLRNAMMFRRGTTPQPPPRSLADVFLWYCQPINPYWRTRGDDAVRSRRQHFARMRPDDPWLNRAMIDNVLRVLIGATDGRPYIGLVDFAACDCEGCGRDTHGPEDLHLINCFWSSDATSRWDANTVRIVRGLAAPVPRPSIGANLSLLVGGTSAVFYWIVPTKRRA